MGGYLNVTIREADGIQHRMVRSTGHFSFFVRNIRIALKDREYYKQYISETEPDNDNGKLMPSQYGIVVFDLMNNVILDMNTYTHVGEMDGTRVALLSRKEPHTVIYTDSDVELAAFKEFCDNKRIKGYRYFTEEEVVQLTPEEIRTHKIIQGGDPKLSDFESFENFVHAAWNPPNRKNDPFNLKRIEPYFSIKGGYFLFDLSPMKVESFYPEHSKQAAEKFLKRLNELGFTLTDEEKFGFKEYVTHE